jgi:hypothetical protein
LIWFGTSWSAPRSRPTSALGTSDMTRSTGWSQRGPRRWRQRIGRARPVVTTMTPGRPDDRA